MASLQDQIIEARKQGYSNSDLRQYLTQSPQYQQAIGAGYSPDEVWNELGLQDQLATPLQIPTPMGNIDLGREGLLFGSSALQGAASLLGTPGNLEQLAQQIPYVGPALQSLESHVPQATGSTAQTIFPTSQDMMNFFGPLDTSPALVPQGFAENKLAALGQGVGAGALMAAMGAPPVPALTSSIGGSLGANVGAEITPDSVTGPVVGSLLGGFTPGGAQEALEGVINFFRDNEGAAQAAADKASALSQSRQADTAELQRLAQERAAGVAGKIGSSPYYQGAGQAIQEETRQWLTGVPEGGDPNAPPVAGSMPDQLNKAFDPLRAAIDASPNAQQLRDAFDSGPTDFLSAMHDADPSGKMAQLYAQGMAKAQQLTNLAQTTARKVVSSGDPNAPEFIRPEDLAKRIINTTGRGSTFVSDLRQIAPNGMDELASSFINPQANEPGGIAAWARLPGHVRSALVPDPAMQQELDAAAAAHSAAPGIVNSRAAMASMTAQALRKLAGSATRNPLLGLMAGDEIVGRTLGALGVPGANVIGPAVGLGLPMIRRGLPGLIKTAPALAMGLGGAQAQLGGAGPSE